jgi:predicted membrane protein
VIHEVAYYIVLSLHVKSTLQKLENTQKKLILCAQVSDKFIESMVHEIAYSLVLSLFFFSITKVNIAKILIYNQKILFIFNLTLYYVFYNFFINILLIFIVYYLCNYKKKKKNANWHHCHRKKKKKITTDTYGKKKK